MKKLKIKNFQVHGGLVLKPGRGVTTITGPSDVGKSAVLRALQWLCLNKPNGASFLKHGEKQTTVTVKVDDKTIQRVRGRTNEYRIGRKIFKAFGSDVPSDVVKVLNLSELNFQGQHDSPFWFSLSPGQVARELNQVIDLQAIDNSVKEGNKRKRAVEAEVKIVRSRWSDAIKKKKTLSWVRKAKEQLKTVKLREEKQCAVHEEHTKLEFLHHKIDGLRDELKPLKELNQATSEVKKIHKQWEGAKEKRLRCLKLYDQMTALLLKKQKTSKRLNSVEEQLHKLTKGKCPVCKRKL